MPLEYANSIFNKFTKEVEERAKYEAMGRKPDNLDTLNVLTVDLNIGENSKKHHTNLYDQTCSYPYKLILRRGQFFFITLHLNREYDHSKDALMLEFDFGDRPSHQKVTKHSLEVQDENFTLSWKWAAKIQEIRGNKIDIEVVSSSQTQVGEWSQKIYSGTRYNNLTSNFFVTWTHPDFVIFLFNPWCKGDDVFLEDEIERNAYVLEDHGVLWHGANVDQYVPMPWNFGQFEDMCLYSSLLTLRQGQYMSDNERSDIVLIVRKLTAAINDFILRGKWEEPYTGGTEPWSWTGSVAILEEYWKDPNKMVKYGQCWVFAGVLTTLCRTLGIPCRPVTNIRSAHDTDRTLTVDNIFLKNPVTDVFELVGESADSIWNFHMWNEIWCKREDLPPGYGGWQAIDATPQELSQGRFQCGPMSLEAVKEGEVKLNYDGWFIYGEVNADVVNWFYKYEIGAPNHRKLISWQDDTRDIGRAVITSSLFDPYELLDLTSQYKPPEGTEKERRALRHAASHVVSKERVDILEVLESEKREGETDVEFETEDRKMIKFGDKIEAKIDSKNVGKAVRHIQMNLDVMILRYTGATDQNIYHASEDVVLKPNEGKTTTLEIPGSFYTNKLKEHSQMCVNIIAHVQETDHIFSDRDIFQIQKPHIYIDGPPTAYRNLPCTFQITFTNPMNDYLTECTLMLEGCGITRSLPVKFPDHLIGRQSVSLKHSVVPKRVGKCTLVVVFNSKELKNLRGSKSVLVQEHEKNFEKVDTV